MKDFKSASIHIFRKLKETVSKEPTECMRPMSHQIENINEESNFLKNQIDILESKSTIIKI